MPANAEARRRRAPADVHTRAYARARARGGFGGAALAAALFIPTVAEAQVAWLELEGTGVAVEYRRLSEEDVDLDAMSAVYYLIGHVQAGRDMQVLVELPFARYGAGDEPIFGEDDPSTALGNLYLGVRRPVSSGRSAFDVGLRLPTTDEDFSAGAALGQLTSLLDRLGAYSPETVTLSGGVGGSTMPSDDAELRGRIGLLYQKYTGDFDADDEAFAHIRGQAFMTFDAVRVGGGVETLFVLTTSGNAGERSLLGATLVAGYDFGTVALGAQLHLPIDEDYGNVIDRVLGLSVEVGL